MPSLGWILNLWASGPTSYNWLGTTSADHAVAANWDPAAVPGTGHSATFNGDGVEPCTLSTAWALANLTAEAGYASKLDLATYDLTMDDGGEINWGGAGTFDLGIGTTISLTNGVFSITAGTIEYATSTLVFNGTCTLGTAEKYCGGMTVASLATVTLTSTVGMRNNTVTINGTLELDGNTFYNRAAYTEFGANGLLSGAGTYKMRLIPAGKGLTVFPAGAEIDCDVCELEAGAAGVLCSHGGTFNAGEHGFSSSNAAASITPEAEAYAFLNDVRFLANASGENLTWDNATNGVLSVTVGGEFILHTVDGNLTVTSNGVATDWVLQGDVTRTIGGAGTLTWTRGTGTITFGGTAAQSVDLDDQTVEAIVVDKAAGTLTFTGGWTAASFTLTAGAVDLNGQTLVTDGNFTAEAGTLSDMSGVDLTVGGDFSVDGVNLIGATGWDLDVTGTATVRNATVTNCTSVNDVDATDNCVDGGGNSENIDFGVTNRRRRLILLRAVA